MCQFVRYLLVYFHPTAVLYILRFLIGRSVQINDTVLDFQSLSRHAHTTLHIVLATVYRTTDYFSKRLLVVFNVFATCLVIVVEHDALLSGIHRRKINRMSQLLACLIAQAIDVFCRNIQGYCIACREVEYHDVVQLYITQAFYTLVIPLRPLQIGFGIDNRQSVLCQRHMKRSLWYSWSITGFAYEQVIAYQQ